MPRVYPHRLFTPKVGGPPFASLLLVSIGHVSTADTVYAGLGPHPNGGVMMAALGCIVWLIFTGPGQSLLVVGSIIWILIAAFKPRASGLGASTSLRAGDFRYLADEARTLRVEYEWLLGTSLANEPVMNDPVSRQLLKELSDPGFTVQNLAMIQFRSRLENHIKNIHELWGSLGGLARRYHGAIPDITKAHGKGVDYWKKVFKDHENDLRGRLRT